jgi:endonuclease III
MTSQPVEEVAERLLEVAAQMDPRELYSTLVPGATDFALANPYAFCLATCLDRGMKSEVIWAIPYWLCGLLGHLDPHRIAQMSAVEIAELVSRLPRKPRYVNDTPRTVLELTNLVVKQYGGDAALIWRDRTAEDVKRTFRTIYGVGPGIASMAVLLIERAYQVVFSDLDHTRMDIKPDVHTMRVLYRVGAASVAGESEAIAAARSLNPPFPGKLDGALWKIGREWCAAVAPRCTGCPLGSVCPKQV